MHNLILFSYKLQEKKGNVSASAIEHHDHESVIRFPIITIIIRLKILPHWASSSLFSTLHATDWRWDWMHKCCRTDFVDFIPVKSSAT